MNRPTVDASAWSALIRSAMGDVEPPRDIGQRIKDAEYDRQLDEFLNYSPVRAFMNVVGQHPGIAGWFSSNISNWEFGPDTEHAAAIRQLLRRRDVSRHIAMKYVTGTGRDLEISSLLNVAE